MNVNRDEEKMMEQIGDASALYKPVGIIRLQMVKEQRTLYGMGRLSTPKEAVAAVKPLFEMCDREVTAVMSVDTKCSPLAVEVVSVGGLDACTIDPRIIYKHALLSNAASVLCFHNHPSGDPEPSVADKRMTERLYEAGKILGVRLLDHIIIGDDAYFSFQEHDMLGKPYIDCA